MSDWEYAVVPVPAGDVFSSKALRDMAHWWSTNWIKQGAGTDDLPESGVSACRTPKSGSLSGLR
jgi:hypothetical protein